MNTVTTPRMPARIILAAAIAVAVLGQAGPASAGTLTYVAGTNPSVSSSAVWVTGTDVDCWVTRTGSGTYIDPFRIFRNVAVYTGQIRMNLSNTAFDEVRTQIWLDRWTGSSWQRGYQDYQYQASIRWSGYGSVYDTVDHTFWNLPPGTYSSYVLYSFYKNGYRVGQAWETPTQGNYSASGGAVVGQTGSNSGYCQVPQV